MPEPVPTRHIGFVLFPKLTQLDLTGPWEVLVRLPDTACHLVSHDLEPVESAGGLAILPSTTFAACPPLDLLFVPGGPGHLGAMEDPVLQRFLVERSASCSTVMAVCTGAMVLAAAGLLRGYRATTHWTSLDRLAGFGAEPVAQRVVIDRDRMTGGGVTAGIDFGLAVVAALEGEALAKQIQLQIEYAPEPPYAGRPESAEPATVEAVRAASARYRARADTVDMRCVARLGVDLPPMDPLPA
jgi:cyclohexyl-isocyanide hydratase